MALKHPPLLSAFACALLNLAPRRLSGEGRARLDHPRQDRSWQVPLQACPSIHHQRVSSALYRQLADFFADFDPEGELFYAPLDVTLTTSNVLQPDMLFVFGARRGILREKRIDGHCDLVVEIMSPTNRRKGRLQKMEIYRKAGIPHYWLVDPEENTLEAFMLRDGSYALATAGGPGDKLTHPEFPGLNLDLDRVLCRSSKSSRRPGESPAVK